MNEPSVKAKQRAASRESALAGIAIRYPEELPVSQRRDDIAEAIKNHQVVIVAGETGSGKTTQLPKICLELGRGVTGQIGHTQPRRIAARTVAERIAEELGTQLGDVVGYKVRFTDRSGDATAVKLMTDGILLAEISTDRNLTRYDTLIIDEAHERSLNIDFILGYLSQLLPRRPDLKVIITSATIDPERFAEHFRDQRTQRPAPIIEVSGRTYPVEVRYRPVADPDDKDEDRDQVTAVTDAIGELEREGPGDILVFLSGEQEIRDTADALKGRAGLDILPLYSRLSSAEQHRVFEVPASRSITSRRVVLATNVAETSLTVPGIRYVIDPGTARISRYSLRTKVQRLPIEAISQASANQRKGRCGRVADGICIRLYSEEDFESRPEFTDPEIQRTNLASVILQMAAARLGDVRRFPFVDPPDPRAITDGVKLLEELNAVKDDRLTETGRQMARLPVDPRIARMIIESGKQGCAREVLVIAAALSIQDPRERPSDNQQAADTAHRRFAQPESDFLAFVALWDYLAERQRELSGSAFRRLCRAEFLNYLRVREWQDLHGQLASLTRDLGINTKTSSSERVRVHTALLAGLLSQVGMKVVLAPARPGSGRPGAPGGPERGRRPLPEYLGARGTKFAVFPGSGLARKPPDWIVAAELVETSRLWARTVAAIEPEWVEPVAAHLVKRSYSEPRWSRAQGSAVATEKVTLYGIPIVADRTVLLHRIDPVLARELFIRHALVEGDWQTRHHFFRDNAKLIEEAASLEQRARRRGLVAGEDALFAFYDARVPGRRGVRPPLRQLVEAGPPRDARPAHVVTGRPAVRRGRRPGRRRVPRGVDLRVARTRRDGQRTGLALTYAFEPGSESDGVTIDIPLKTLNQARPEEFSWQVPGLRLELVTELVRTLPKNLRRELVPAPNVAREILASLNGAAPGADVRETMSRELLRLRGVQVPPDAFDLDKLPPHLRITFRVLDGAKVVASGKDLAALQRQLRPKVRATLSARATALTRTGVTSWDFGPLPRVFTDGEVKAYPALVDAGAPGNPGGTVDVRLFETAPVAARAMRAGTRRLVLLAVKSPANEVAKRLSTAQKLVLSDNPHGSVPALFADCVSCAVDGLITEAGGPAWDAEGFGRIVEHVRPRLHAATYEVVAWAEEILRGAHQARMRLGAMRSAALEPAVVDIRAQLDGLIAPGFLTAAGTGRLPAIARYVKAAGRRLDKVTENAGRDAQQMAVVHRVQDAYARALSSLPPEARVSSAAREIRWQIEELRVSLFAQTIGTPAPVSERRIMTSIENLS